MSDPARKVTLQTLRAMRERGQPAVCVTAYDYPTALFADRAGVDMLLVGDSAAIVVLGCSSTLSVGMTEMLMFARAVARGATRAFVIGDMPYLSYQPSSAGAVRNAGAFLAAGCDAVKCEGGARVAKRVRAMTNAGIPVMGHLGLTPQSVSQLGGYRVQGKKLPEVQRIIADAIALEEAGAFALMLEAMPAEAAAFVRDEVTIPSYGVGAGPKLDGQCVVSNDILGTFAGDSPKFVKRYADLDRAVQQAFETFANDVRSRGFPAPEHCYMLDAKDLAAISRAHAAHRQARNAAQPVSTERS